MHIRLDLQGLLILLARRRKQQVGLCTAAGFGTMQQIIRLHHVAPVDQVCQLRFGLIIKIGVESHDLVIIALHQVYPSLLDNFGSRG